MFTRDRSGSASIYMEPFGTDPGVYTGPFWNRSGTDPKLDLQNSRSSFGSGWIRSGQVPGRSRMNRRPWIRLEPVPCKHSLNDRIY